MSQDGNVPRYPIDEFGYPAPRMEAHPTLASYLASRTEDEIGALIWCDDYRGNIFGTYPGTVGEHSATIIQAIKDRASQAKLREVEKALNWAMDEIDVLSNRLCEFAYPQGMAMVGRRDQLDNYRKAIDARRAALRTLGDTQ